MCPRPWTKQYMDSDRSYHTLNKITKQYVNTNSNVVAEYWHANRRVRHAIPDDTVSSSCFHLTNQPTGNTCKLQDVYYMISSDTCLLKVTVTMPQAPEPSRSARRRLDVDKACETELTSLCLSSSSPKLVLSGVDSDGHTGISRCCNACAVPPGGHQCCSHAT